MTHEIQIAQSTFLSTHIKKRISVCGIYVDEDFVKAAFEQMSALATPVVNDVSFAYELYIQEACCLPHS